MEPVCNGNETPENLEESQQERKKWSDVLHCVLSAIMYLAKQGIPSVIPWRRRRTVLKRSKLSPENKGSVFSILEFLAVFDAVLKELF